jgi:hypothetical protein
LGRFVPQLDFWRALGGLIWRPRVAGTERDLIREFQIVPCELASLQEAFMQAQKLEDFIPPCRPLAGHPKIHAKLIRLYLQPTKIGPDVGPSWRGVISFDPDTFLREQLARPMF